jgi:hypothetical protein
LSKIAENCDHNIDPLFQVGAMTTDQIREMMANTLKEIGERKKTLANLKGPEGAGSKQVSIS